MKFFRDKWDYYHFFGPFFFPFLMAFIVVYPVIAQVFTIFLLFLFPWLWEYWDEHKVLYNDERTLQWTNIEKAIFTSDGFFDRYDLKLGYAGMYIGFMLLTVILYFV